MRLLLRLAVLVGSSILYMATAHLLLPSDDGLGAGLLWFLLLVIVSGVWGLWDGCHATAIGALIARWAVVALAVGLTGPLQIWATGGRDLDVLLSDLGFLTPFEAGLVFVPAAVGIAVGFLARHTRRASRSPDQRST